LIGQAISNTQVYIVDKAGSLVPPGVPGEICLAGAGLARGYLNQPALTGEKFIANPFSHHAGDRLYKTGDLGKWLPDGNIAYLGRLDDQVKIRGFRIELGEIESAISETGLVNQCVVLAREGKSGSKRLVAYIVPGDGFNKQELVSLLEKRLPGYMVPDSWLELEKMPLTPNGKINKKALPDADAAELLQRSYVAPRNDLERTLADIWQDLLKVERVGIHDNFFELGGHSLLVMRMVSAIQKKLLVSIPINLLFQFTTIDGLSKFLEIEMTPEQPEDESVVFDQIII
jgi:acyl carrier protein